MKLPSIPAEQLNSVLSSVALEAAARFLTQPGTGLLIVEDRSDTKSRGTKQVIAFGPAFRCHAAEDAIADAREGGVYEIPIAVVEPTSQ